MTAIAPILSPAELLQALRVDTSNETRPAIRDDELRSRAARAPRWPLVALAAAAGVVASLLLVPNGGEGDDPSRVPVLTKLEAALASGDRSPETVIALARERQRVGQTASGLALLQDLVTNEPRRVAAWQALGDMLHEQGRRDDALAALERAQRLAPTPDRERLIASRREPARIAGPASPRFSAAPAVGATHESLQQASSLLASGRPREALDVLDGFARRRPDAVDTGVVALQMQALLAIRVPNGASAKARAAVGPGAAQARAVAWLKQRPQTAVNEVATLATTLARDGQHGLAARVLDPWLAQGGEDLVAVWARSMRASGQGGAALTRLARLGTPKASAEVLRQRVRFAVEAGKVDAALDAVRVHGPQQAPPDVLVMLVEAATHDTNRLQARTPLLRDLWSRAGKQLERHDPLTAARAAWAAGDLHAAAGLATAAAPLCKGKADCAVRLAWVNHQLGRGPEAAAALESVEGPIDDALVSEFARLSVLHSVASDSLVRLERQRRPVPSAAFDAAWALLATVAGRQADVLRWIDTARSDHVSPATVRELFDAATQAKAHGLTMATGLRLDPRAVRPADRVLLAQAMMDSGRTAEALAQWRQVRSSSKAYDDAYVSALRVALSRGVGTEARQEFAKAQLVTLRRVPSRDPRRDAVVQQLVDLGAHGEAFPSVESLAQSDPGRWLATYEDIARKVGRTDRLPAMWRRVAVHPALEVDQRLRVADALAAAGDARATEPALRILAADAVPGDPIAQRLIALWGPTLSLDQVDWIEARALASGARGRAPDVAQQHRAAWMQQLNEHGAAARTVALYRRLQPRPPSGPVFDAHVDALRRLGDQAAVDRALAEAGRSAP